MLSEIIQPEKNKCCMISLICEIRKYNQLVNMIKKKQTYIENKIVVTRERGRWEGQDRGGGLRGTEQ